MKKIIILLVLLSATAYGELPAVTSIETITPEETGSFYHPKFSPDGERVLLTRERFIGLWEHNLNSGRTTLISSDAGAGYEAAYAPDGKSIYFLRDTYENKRRFRSLMKYDRESKRLKTVMEKERLLTPPLKVTDQGVVTRTDSKMLLTGSDRKAENPEIRLVHTFENHLTLYENGKEKMLTPSGEGNYVWASLSPDEEKILYNKAGEGTFVCDMNGKILAELGYANAPEWSPNGRWIAYMKDYDDGHFITESEIWIASADGKESRKLTNTEDQIEMYPRWAPDSRALIFHDLSGTLYLMKLNVTE